jgi:hypothetical protein
MMMPMMLATTAPPTATPIISLRFMLPEEGALPSVEGALPPVVSTVVGLDDEIETVRGGPDSCLEIAFVSFSAVRSFFRADCAYDAGRDTQNAMSMIAELCLCPPVDVFTLVITTD